jgi:hypothetical protein
LYFKIFCKFDPEINNLNISISEFTRGPRHQNRQAPGCTSLFYVSSSFLANTQRGRKEITERERGVRERIVEGKSTVKYEVSDIIVDFITEALLTLKSSRMRPPVAW